jgi:chromosome segregation ATPase
MMKSNPIEITPGNKFIVLQDGRRSRRFGMYARHFAIAGLAMLFVPSFLNDLAAARESAETTARIEVAQVSDEQHDALEQERRRGDALARELASARAELEARKAAAKTADDATQAAQALAIEHQQVGERERQLGEVLARQLASAQKAIETLMARVVAMTDARTEAEKALQAAQASVAEQGHALEQERRRGDALARELASAREEVEARKAAAKAADDAVQTAQALAIEHQQVGERERQLGEALARQLASAQKEVETLTARVAAMAAARPAEQTLQDARALATHQRQALDQDRQRRFRYQRIGWEGR